MKKTKNLKEAQIFTPPNITNQMLDMIDQDKFADHETYFFEPSCGDGAMLVEIVERIYTSLLKKSNNSNLALAETLFKFYAIELDSELVPKARTRIYEWAMSKLSKEPTELEMYLIANSLQNSIENKDFFKVVGDIENRKIPKLTNS